MKAILLSGGIDSTAIAYWLKPEVAIHVSYGQRCALAELNASRAIAETLSLSFHHIAVDLSILGSGDLAGDAKLAIAPTPEWWPFRNQMLVTLACMKALAIEVDTLLIGSVSTDNRHSDGTSDFFQQLNRVINIQEGHLQLSTPAIQMTTMDVVKVSKLPKAIIGWTHSCHTGNLPCGYCNGCQKHLSIKHQLKLL